MSRPGTSDYEMRIIAELQAMGHSNGPVGNYCEVSRDIQVGDRVAHLGEVKTVESLFSASATFVYLSDTLYAVYYTSVWQLPPLLKEMYRAQHSI